MRESTTSEVLEQGEVGEAVGEHAADAVDVDDRLVGPLLRLRRRRALRRPRERSHRIGFREGRSKVKARRENAALRSSRRGWAPSARGCPGERLDARAGLCSGSVVWRGTGLIGGDSDGIRSRKRMGREARRTCGRGAGLVALAVRARRHGTEGGSGATWALSGAPVAVARGCHGDAAFPKQISGQTLS